MDLRKIGLLIFSLIISKTVIFGNDKHTISGKIIINTGKPVYIYLVDKQHSKKPFTGVRTLIKNPGSTEVNKGYIFFSFSDLPSGIYGIRCFQDLNNNKKLDQGIFGPSEPWGFSWNKIIETKQIPNFENYSFVVDNDIKDLIIILNY